MANLVTTNAQLKEYNSAINFDADFGSFNSFELDAQINYLVPAIGQLTYDALCASGLSGNMLSAQILFRKAEVNFIVAAWVNFGSVQIGESGIYVTQTGDKKIASDKKVSALRKQCFIDAWVALEAGVNFLENNIGSFANYAASPQHVQNRGAFINTTLDFNRYAHINLDAQLFAALNSAIVNAEKQYIEPALGADFTAIVRAAILNNGNIYSISASLKKQLMDAIGYTLAPFALVEAIPFQLLQIEGDRVAINTTGNGGMSSGNTELQEAATQNTLQILFNACVKRGEDNLARLRKFLNDHVGDFADYVAVDTTTSANINNVERGTYFL